MKTDELQNRATGKKKRKSPLGTIMKFSQSYFLPLLAKKTTIRLVHFPPDFAPKKEGANTKNGRYNEAYSVISLVL